MHCVQRRESYPSRGRACCIRNIRHAVGEDSAWCFFIFRVRGKYSLSNLPNNKKVLNVGIKRVIQLIKHDDKLTI